MLLPSVAPPATPGAYRFLKRGIIIYVGSGSNLRERIRQHSDAPHNPCIARQGFDFVEYQPTPTVRQAEELECTWYNLYRPMCNLVAPPHCASTRRFTR